MRKQRFGEDKCRVHACDACVNSTLSRRVNWSTSSLDDSIFVTMAEGASSNSPGQRRRRAGNRITLNATAALCDSCPVCSRELTPSFCFLAGGTSFQHSTPSELDVEYRLVPGAESQGPRAGRPGKSFLSLAQK